MKGYIAAVLGFMVAPIFPALMLGIRTPLTPERPDPITILGLLPIGYFFGALATAVFGVPAFFVLKRLGLIRWWSAIASGFAIGALVASVLIGGAVLLWGSTGAFSALVFWLIWKQGKTESEVGVGRQASRA